MGVALIEDLSTGSRYPLRRDRFSIGGRGADLVVPGAEETVTVILDPSGDCWLGMGDSVHACFEGEAVIIAERSFRLRMPRDTRTATQGVDAVRYPYALRATLDEGPGPEGRLENLDTGVHHRVVGDTRATLLYVLARKLVEDSTAQRPKTHCGWCTNHEVTVGVWGAAGVDDPVNSLHVLVRRVRREVQQAGFEPWFLERRRGHMRARVAEASITG